MNYTKLGNFEIYSQTTDMYSFGMVLYEMFSGKIPFEEMEDDQVKINKFKCHKFCLMQEVSYILTLLDINKRSYLCWGPRPGRLFLVGRDRKKNFDSYELRVFLNQNRNKIRNKIIKHFVLSHMVCGSTTKIVYR